VAFSRPLVWQLTTGVLAAVLVALLVILVR
jgi:hypothetical protein